MIGRIGQDQGQLFYSFNLEQVVPDDHLVRAIARVVDLSWVRAELAPHYSPIGRPSVDPVLMIRMLIVGYVFTIRSERALCREVQLNLAYRWFCGLGIEDKMPDHSAFSRARNERFRDSDIFRRLFERVVGTCVAAGLVGGEGFAVDASLIQTDANKHRSIPGAEWNKDIDPERAHRAVKEYLATLDEPAYGAVVTPKFVSPSDPAAQWTGALRNAAFFAYADNYLIDVRFGIIMDVEASRAIRQAEVGASKTMIERTEACFGIKPAWLAADTAYGSASNLDWMVNQQGIAPHVPVIDKSQRGDGTFSREDFILCDVLLDALLNGYELIFAEVRPALRLHDFAAISTIWILPRVPCMPQHLDVGTGNKSARFQKFLEVRIGRSNNSHLFRHVITASAGITLFQSSAYNFLISASVRPALRACSLPMFLTRASASRSMPDKIGSCRSLSCGLPSLSL